MGACHWRRAVRRPPFLPFQIMDVVATVDGLPAGVTAGGCVPVDAAALEALLAGVPLAAQRRCPGGSAANVARAVAALTDDDVAFMGAAGDDGAAAEYASGLTAASVTALLLPPPPSTTTGVCLALVTPDGQRTMRTSLGAAASFREATAAPAGWAQGATAVHVEGYALWRQGLVEGLLQEVRRASPTATTSLDCASVEVVAARGDALWAAIAAGLVDILFCNEEEAAALAAAAGGGDPLDAAVRAGARMAVASLGAAGARCAFRDETSRGGVGTAAAPAASVAVVDTVGAGDAFAGGVLAALLAGASPEIALQSGAAAGAAAVAAAGADPGAAGWAAAAAAGRALVVREPAAAPA